MPGGSHPDPMVRPIIEMDSSIRTLYEEGKIDARAALDKAIDKELFKDLLDEREDSVG